MNDIEPKKTELQIDHVCCICGKHLLTGSMVMWAVVPLRVREHWLATQRIAWCDDCWKHFR